MIAKKDFVSAVNSIKEVESFYRQYGHKCYVKNSLIQTLIDAVSDKYEWIAWYINTTRYGEVNNTVSFGEYGNEAKHYIIKTVDDLYDFLADYYHWNEMDYKYE